MSEKFVACTLVDITDTGITNRNADIVEQHQEQNLNTLLQILGLRAQVFDYTVLKLEAQDMSNYEFGSNYAGTIQDVWQFSFSVETVDIWTNGEDATYHAGIDCDRVPVYTGLLETSLIMPFFSALDTSTKNIYFKTLD
jgi:hypothetical protein